MKQFARKNWMWGLLLVGAVALMGGAAKAQLTQTTNTTSGYTRPGLITPIRPPLVSPVQP